MYATMGALPLILQGAAQRETLSPEQLTRLQAQGIPTTSATGQPAGVNVSSMLPFLIIGGIAAWFLAGESRRRSLFTVLMLLLPVALTAQTPWKQDVVSGSDTLTVYGNYLTLTTVKVDSVVKKFVPPPIVLGRPYGPSGMIHDMKQPYTPFTADPNASSSTPAFLLDNLTKARQRGVKMVAALPCGSHNLTNLGNCLVKKGDTVMFSRARFDSALATYNTPAVKAALDTAYRTGVLVAVNLMDEPWVKGAGDGNTWGPKGLTRAQADSLCRTAKAGAFKGIPVGTSDVSPSIWPTTTKLLTCDIGIAQFSFRFGDPVKWRDTILVSSASQGYQSIFSFNIVNGGTQDRDGTWDCAAQGGIKGTSSPNCTMTSPQVIASGTALGSSGCGSLMMWRYDSTRYAKLGMPTGPFKSVADLQKQRAVTVCKVRP